MNYKQIEKQIENQISKFSNIDYKLNEYTIKFSNRVLTEIVLININIRDIREEYILDAETFEVLDQVE